MVCSRCNTENPDGNKFCGKCGSELADVADSTTVVDANAVPGEPGAFYCGRHPKVVTRLRCGRCETPICPKCMVYTPAGARCRDCSRNKVAARPAGIAHEAGNFLGNLFYSCGPYRFWYLGAGILFILSAISRVYWMFRAPMLPQNYASITTQANKAEAVSNEGRRIYKAVNDYRAATGKYPDTLNQLVPKYISLSELHTSADNDPNPAHVSWKYYKPADTSSPKAPMIETSIEINYDGSSINQPVTINIDGSAGSSED